MILINVVQIPMEHGMHEMITQNQDGSFTIFINARDSHERRMESYNHALHHINNNDFEKSDVQEIEYEAHREVI